MARFFACMPVVIVLILFLVSGFAATGLLGLKHGFFSPPLPQGIISAHCAIFGQDGVEADHIRIKCGLSGEEVTSVVTQVLEGHGLDQIRQGRDPDADEIAATARRLGLSNDAALSLLEGFKPSESKRDTSRTKVAQRPIPATAVVVSTSASAPTRPVELRETGFVPPEIVIETNFQGESPETEEVVRSAADCTVMSGSGKVVAEDIVKDCGPDRSEIEALVESVIGKSDIQNLQAAFQGDHDARQSMYRELAKAYHLNDEVVASAVEQIEASDAPGTELADRLDMAMRERLRIVVMLKTMGVIADLLRENQGKISQAVLAGDMGEVDRLFIETGLPLHDLANDLAPAEREPEIEVARLALEARKQLGDGEFVGAAIGFENAAGIAGEIDPLLALVYSSQAASAYLLDPAVSQAHATWAFERTVQNADTFEAVAFNLVLGVAASLVSEGGGQAGTTTLATAADLLDRLGRTVESEREPWRAFQVDSLQASLLWELTVRTGSAEIGLQGEAVADEALMTADANGLDRNEAALTWANIQLQLGEILAEPERDAKALRAYEQIIASSVSGSEMWRVATSNKATIEMQEALETGNADMLRQAGETYRSLVDWHETQSELWAHDLRKLASVMSTIGQREDDSSALRESLSLLDEVKAYYSDRGADLYWADTMSQQADVLASIGTTEKNPAAIDQAADLMDEVSRIYNSETLPEKWLNFQLIRASLQQRAALISDGPDAYLSAAETYAYAREALSDKLRPLLVGKLAAEEAKARLLAGGRGAPLDETEKARELVSLIDELSDQNGGSGSEEWTALADQAAIIQSEIAILVEEEK